MLPDRKSLGPTCSNPKTQAAPGAILHFFGWDLRFLMIVY